jgi:uncharacterized protein YhhL (DUF1145 family)
MKKDQLDYLSDYMDRCWAARQYYKDECNKLLCWVATLFLAIVGATGIFGANQNTRFDFSLKHMLLFHAVGIVVWVYYLYKQLNADMFEKLGILIEEYVRLEKGFDDDGHFQGFFSLKDHYLGKLSGHGRSLTRYANMGILIIYLTVTGWPLFHGGLANGALKVNWEFLVVSLAFPMMAFASWRVYIKEKKRVLADIEQRWQLYLQDQKPLPHLPKGVKKELK